VPVISIDLGTTGSKAAVFEGKLVLGSAYRHYSYASPRAGWAGQQTEDVWSLVNSTVLEAVGPDGRRPPIGAVCISVQGDAIVPINSNCSALHPAILGMDTRRHEEAGLQEAHFSRGQLYAAAGMPCEPLNAITKIWWLAQHHPELRDQLWKCVHYGEFLLMKLAGIPALDFTMASRTMAFDPIHEDWLPEVLDFTGVTRSQLGNLAPPGVPVGIIRNAIADECGINRNALVVLGGHDQCMTAVGADVTEPDLACYSMGTAEVIGTCFESPRMTAQMLEANCPCYCHAIGNRYVKITLNQSSGLSLEWFLENVLGTGALVDAAPELRIEPPEVLFMPHLVGSGTPTCDHLSRGTFLGLSIKTGRVDMIQAVADALAFEAQLNPETLENPETYVGELRAVGGGARSRKMLELKATALNRPTRTVPNREAALLGVAMLAQIDVGVFPNLGSARDEYLEIDCTIEPNRSAVDAYSAALDRYRQLYTTLKSFYRNWSVECRTPVPA